MSETDMLLIMTLCDLLGKSTDPRSVERAYQKAKAHLQRVNQPKDEATPPDWP
jgi:hypothetical protein